MLGFKLAASQVTRLFTLSALLFVDVADESTHMHPKPEPWTPSAQDPQVRKLPQTL